MLENYIGMDIIYDFLFSLFSVFCHQITERSFQSLDGRQFFVCARDTGTYLGFLISFLPFWNRFFRLYGFKFDVGIILGLFFFHLILFGIDGVSSYAGWRETNNLIRYFTGFYMGFFLGILFQYVEFWFFRSDQGVDSSRSEYIEKAGIKQIFFRILILELWVTVWFIITASFMKYLLYLLAFSIVFYVYRIFRLILSLFSLRDVYYYLILAVLLFIFWGLVFWGGISKINVIHRVY